MSLARYVVDTSALVRLLRNPDALRPWREPLTAGLLAICPVVELELLYTARSREDRDKLFDLLRAAYTWVAMPERVFDRAAAVQATLTTAGAHRSAGAVDLLLAATAELHGLTLLHYDHDFERIGDVTEQPTAWLAAPGTLS